MVDNRVIPFHREVEKCIFNLGIGYSIGCVAEGRLDSVEYACTLKEARDIKQAKLEGTFTPMHKLRWLKNRRVEELLPYTFFHTNVEVATKDEFFDEFLNVFFLYESGLVLTVSDKTLELWFRACQDKSMYVWLLNTFLRKINKSLLKLAESTSKYEMYEKVTDESRIVTVAENKVTHEILLLDKSSQNRLLTLEELSTGLYELSHESKGGDDE